MMVRSLQDLISYKLIKNTVMELKKNPKVLPVKTGIKVGKGLGDYVADLTHATGLDQVADLYTEITGQPCGCEERQEMLNNLVPNI